MSGSAADRAVRAIVGVPRAPGSARDTKDRANPGPSPEAAP